MLAPVSYKLGIFSTYKLKVVSHKGKSARSSISQYKTYLEQSYSGDWRWRRKKAIDFHEESVTL